MSATTPATPRSISFQRSTPQQQQHTTTLPINLSLSEDERSPNRSNADPVSPRSSKASHTVAKSSRNINHPVGSQIAEDDEEQLYEYFPLTVDDWYAPPPSTFLSLSLSFFSLSFSFLFLPFFLFFSLFPPFFLS